MQINPDDAQFWFPLPGPRNPLEQEAHRIGLQNWHRQFQPSFSPDTMVVHEFANPLSRSLGKNVRGPQAFFAPGGADFNRLFAQQVPRRAFYYDPVFGIPRPEEFPNRWGSNQAARARRLPSFAEAVFKQ